MDNTRLRYLQDIEESLKQIDTLAQQAEESLGRIEQGERGPSGYVQDQYKVNRVRSVYDKAEDSATEARKTASTITPTTDQTTILQLKQSIDALRAVVVANTSSLKTEAMAYPDINYTPISTTATDAAIAKSRQISFPRKTNDVYSAAEIIQAYQGVKNPVIDYSGKYDYENPVHPSSREYRRERAARRLGTYRANKQSDLKYMSAFAQAIINVGEKAEYVADTVGGIGGASGVEKAVADAKSFIANLPNLVDNPDVTKQIMSSLVQRFKRHATTMRANPNADLFQEELYNIFDKRGISAESFDEYAKSMGWGNKTQRPVRQAAPSPKRKILVRMPGAYGDLAVISNREVFGTGEDDDVTGLRTDSGQQQARRRYALPGSVYKEQSQRAAIARSLNNSMIAVTDAASGMTTSDVSYESHSSLGSLLQDGRDFVIKGMMQAIVDSVQDDIESGKFMDLNGVQVPATLAKNKNIAIRAANQLGSMRTLEGRITPFDTGMPLGVKKSPDASRTIARGLMASMLAHYMSGGTLENPDEFQSFVDSYTANVFGEEKSPRVLTAEKIVRGEIDRLKNERRKLIKDAVESPALLQDKSFQAQSLQTTQQIDALEYILEEDPTDQMTPKQLAMNYFMPNESLRKDLRGLFPRGVSTKDLVLSGRRTATTRVPTGYSKGDVVQVGEKLFRIDDIIKPDFSTEAGKKAWSAREGWDYDTMPDKARETVDNPLARQILFSPVSANDPEVQKQLLYQAGEEKRQNRGALLGLKRGLSKDEALSMLVGPAMELDPDITARPDWSSQLVKYFNRVYSRLAMAGMSSPSRLFDRPTGIRQAVDVATGIEENSEGLQKEIGEKLKATQIEQNDYGEIVVGGKRITKFKPDSAEKNYMLSELNELQEKIKKQKIEGTLPDSDDLERISELQFNLSRSNITVPEATVESLGLTSQQAGAAGIGSFARGLLETAKRFRRISAQRKKLANLQKNLADYEKKLITADVEERPAIQQSIAQIKKEIADVNNSAYSGIFDKRFGESPRQTRDILTAADDISEAADRGIPLLDAAEERDPVTGRLLGIRQFKKKFPMFAGIVQNRDMLNQLQSLAKRRGDMDPAEIYGELFSVLRDPVTAQAGEMIQKLAMERGHDLKLLFSQFREGGSESIQGYGEDTDTYRQLFDTMTLFNTPAEALQMMQRDAEAVGTPDSVVGLAVSGKLGERQRNTATSMLQRTNIDDLLKNTKYFAYKMRVGIAKRVSKLLKGFNFNYYDPDQMREYGYLMPNTISADREAKPVDKTAEIREEFTTDRGESLYGEDYTMAVADEIARANLAYAQNPTEYNRNRLEVLQELESKESDEDDQDVDSSGLTQSTNRIGFTNFAARYTSQRQADEYLKKITVPSRFKKRRDAFRIIPKKALRRIKSTSGLIKTRRLRKYQQMLGGDYKGSVRENINYIKSRFARAAQEKETARQLESAELSTSAKIFTPEEAINIVSSVASQEDDQDLVNTSIPTDPLGYSVTNDGLSRIAQYLQMIPKDKPELAAELINAITAVGFADLRKLKNVEKFSNDSRKFALSNMSPERAAPMSALFDVMQKMEKTFGEPTVPIPPNIYTAASLREDRIKQMSNYSGPSLGVRKLSNLDLAGSIRLASVFKNFYDARRALDKKSDMSKRDREYALQAMEKYYGSADLTTEDNLNKFNEDFAILHNLFGGIDPRIILASLAQRKEEAQFRGGVGQLTGGKTYNEILQLARANAASGEFTSVKDFIQAKILPNRGAYISTTATDKEGRTTFTRAGDIFGGPIRAALSIIEAAKLIEKPSTEPSELNIWAGSDENTALSNLAVRPFTYKGKSYNSVEQAYQSLRTGKFNEDVYNMPEFIPFVDKSGVKRVRKPRITETISTEESRKALMEELMLASFEQNEDARSALLSTGTATLTHKEDKGMWSKVFPEILTKIREKFVATISKPGVLSAILAGTTALGLLASGNMDSGTAVSALALGGVFGFMPRLPRFSADKGSASGGTTAYTDEFITRQAQIKALSKARDMDPRGITSSEALASSSLPRLIKEEYERIRSFRESLSDDKKLLFDSVFKAEYEKIKATLPPVVVRAKPEEKTIIAVAEPDPSLSTEYTDADRAAGESYESVREEKTTAAPEEKPVAPKKPAIEPLSVGKGPGGSPTPVWIVGQSGALHIVGAVSGGAGKSSSGTSKTVSVDEDGVETVVDNETQGDYPQVPAYVRSLLTGLDAFRNTRHIQLSKETDPLKIEALQKEVQLATRSTLRSILKMDKIREATGYAFDENLDFNDNLKEASKRLATNIRATEAASGKPSPDQVTAALTLEKLAQTSRFQTQSLTQRPPNTYAGGTGGAVRERGGASYDSSLVALQLARNAFDQASGQIVGGSMVGARKYLIDQTRQAITGIFGMPQVESVVDPITGAAKDVSKVLDTSMLTASGDIDVAAIEEASNTFNSQFTDFTGNTGASMDELAADLANLGQVLVALSRIVDESRNKLKGLIESEQKRLESLKADPVATAADIDSAEQRILDLRKQEQALNGYTDSLATTTKTVGMAANVQKQSGGVLDTGSARSIESYDQQMKAIISRPGLLAGFSRAADRRRTTAAFARDFAGEEGAKILMGAQGLVAYTNSGARVDIAKANTEQLTNLQTRLNKAGSAVSMEQLIRLQQTAAQLQSVKNQQPFGDKVFYLAAKMRDYQTIFDTAVQYTLGAPRMLAGAIQQAANPALTAARTMVTAQGLSRSPEVYGAALGAASTQQSMFGGSLTSNLGQITSFIPLTNAYGVDINQVVNVARKLAAFDPAQGMEGASIAIKEFLSGNVASLSRRFEINRSALSKINQGDASQMLDSLDEVLGQMGVTDRLIDEQANSLGAKYDKMLGRLESAEIAISTFAVEAITPALDWLAGPDSFLASKAKEMSLTTARDERMKFAADSILTNKETGFGSEDLNIFAEDYFQKADAIIADANDEIIKQAMLYQSTTGKIATVSPYRRLANMSPEQRAAFRYSAVQNMEKGMNQAQAQLQALRDIGGDYATFQEFAPQRQLVGSTPIMSQEQRDAYARRSREISSQNVEFVEATIVGNVDADTIRVDMPGFEEQSVRIAGIDAPEKIFGEGETAKNLAAEILKVGDKVFLPKKNADFSFDDNGRIVSEVYMKNMQNYGLIALEKGLATTGFMDKSGFSAEQQQIYSAFEAAAAEQGIGPVNERSYKLGAGANFAISQEAKDKYFRDTYLMGIDFDLGKMLGISAATGTAGAFSVPFAAGLGMKGILAATAAEIALPALGFAALPALAGAAYYGYAKSTDMNDTSAEKLKELNLIEDEFRREARFRTQGQAIIQMAGNSLETPVYLSADTKSKYLRAQSSGEYTEVYSNPTGGMPLVVSKTPEEILAGAGEKDREKFLEEFTERKKVSDEALEERYNQASEIEKQFFDAIITSPIDGQKVTYFEYRSTYDAMQQMAANGNQGMADLLDEIGQEKLLAPIEGMLALKEYEDTLKIAEKYGLTYMTMPEFSGPSYIQASQAAQAKPVRKAFNMDDFASASTAKRMSMLMQIQEQIFNPQNFKIQAKEYTNQMLEESMQIRQKRFNTVVEANAMNAMAGLGFTNFGAIQSGRVPLESATIMGNDFISAETRAKGMLRLQEIGAGVEQDSDAAEELDTAQANAVAKLQELAKAYQEQASATLANTVMYNSSFANLAAAISMSSAGFNNMMDIMGQGDPFFAQKYFRQMSGVDFLSVTQGGIFSPFTSTGILGNTSVPLMSNAQVGVNGTPIQMIAGRNGAMQFENSYTQGPRGAIAFANDMQSNPVIAQMLNPQQYFQTILAPAIAGQTELTRRGIQQGNQMRDLQRQHNYSLEDITRNGMRQLESIHRNYTRNMYQLTLNNELVKRMNNANMHQSILAADISEEDRNDLLAFVAQNQQKIRHSEQGDVTNFLASTQLEGADVDALRAAEAAYQAVPFTDPTKKEEAQLARMAAAETVKTRLDTMIAEEKDPQKRADLLKQRALLDKDPARAAAAEQLLLPEVQRRLGDAVNRRAFGYAKEDRDFELSGLGLRRAGLLKARDDAYKADKTDPVAYGLGIQNAERNLLEFDRANNIATRNFGNLARGIDAASMTAPMFEDAFTTGMNNALTNTSTTLSGILTEYDEFGIGIRNQIEDEALNFERQRLALITSFSDALVEIAAQVPATLQNATQAYMEFASADALAQAELQSGNVSGARAILQEASTNYAKRMFPDDPERQKSFNSLIMKGAPQGPNKSPNGLTVGGLSDFAIQTAYGIAMKTYQVGDSGTAAKPNSVNPSGVAPITIIVPQKGTGAGAFNDDGLKGRKIYYLNPQ